MKKTRIGLLGTGDVGRALSTGFAALGHEVKIRSPEPRSDKVSGMVAKPDHAATAGTFADTAAFAEVAVLATLWSGPESALKLAEPATLTGKVVIRRDQPAAVHPQRAPGPGARPHRLGGQAGAA